MYGTPHKVEPFSGCMLHGMGLPVWVEGYELGFVVP